MVLPRPCTAAALALVLTAVYGCGSQRAQRPAEQAADIARAFLADCARGQLARAKDLLTPPARSAFEEEQGSGRTACLRFLGLTTSAEALSDSQQRDLLRQTTAKVVADPRSSAQFAMVVLEAPEGRRHRLQLERWAGEWLLTEPVPQEKLEEVRSERAARNAVASFTAFCTRHEYKSAETLLTVSALRDFEATGGEATACLMFLGLSKAGEALPPPERDVLLRHTKIADISDVERSSAKVSVTAPPERKAQVEAEDTGRLWRLSKPDGSARDAAKSLLDACSHLQYETAAELLTKPARTNFLVHGGRLEACLRFLGLEEAASEPDKTVRAALDEATVSVAKSGDDVATVEVDVPDHGRRKVRAERDGDAWKLAGVTP